MFLIHLRYKCVFMQFRLFVWKKFYGPLNEFMWVSKFFYVLQVDLLILISIATKILIVLRMKIKCNNSSFCDKCQAVSHEWVLNLPKQYFVSGIMIFSFYFVPNYIVIWLFITNLSIKAIATVLVFLSSLYTYT